MSRRWLALSSYPEYAPSFHHRLRAYRAHWRQAGVELECRSFFTPWLFERRRRFGRGAALWKLLGLLYCCLRLPWQLRGLGRYEGVILHREFFPLGPAWIERYIARRARRCLYDLDDAIWHPPSNGINQRRWLWDPRRVAHTMASCERVVVGNEYLAGYARDHARRVEIIPTTYEDLGGAGPRGQVPPVVLWIGNLGNAGYLERLAAPLARVAARVPFVLRVVGGADIDRLELPGVRLERLRWSRERELEALASADVGIMPLEDLPYEQGKCAFKLIQYLSAGLPVVASPVGTNRQVVDPEVGYLAADDRAWEQALTALLTHLERRQTMGRAGYRKYRDGYTRQEGAHRWLALMDRAPLEATGSTS